MKVNRRKFITAAAATGALTLLPHRHVAAAPLNDSYATLIDLEKCDGCSGSIAPLCAAACREGRRHSFPRPKKDHLRDYWPQKRHEDWSAKQAVHDRFTPYNWMFVQKVDVEGRQISIPRRCMHCDNPPCAKLCPFGVNHKSVEGPVYIDHNLCFGGAKCRTVCPWHVPQRQAGVGIYTLWQKYLPVGGGVMYKCDLCRDRLKAGKVPHCIEACPRGAMHIGRREEIFRMAKDLRRKYNGDIYGVNENGGTSTLYVSPVPFRKIDEAIKAQNDNHQAGTPHSLPRLNTPTNILDKSAGWAYLSLLSPLAGILAAIGLSWRRDKEKP